MARVTQMVGDWIVAFETVQHNQLHAPHMTVLFKNGLYNATLVMEVPPHNNRYTFTTERGDDDFKFDMTTSCNKKDNILFVHCHLHNDNFTRWFTLRHTHDGSAGPTVVNQEQECCLCLEKFVVIDERPWLQCNKCLNLMHIECIMPERPSRVCKTCPLCRALL